MPNEFERLTQIVRELAESQKEATQGSQRVEAGVAELVNAQVSTFKVLGKLINDQLETRRLIGGVATAVGFTLENTASRALPALLQTDLGVRVHGRLIRKWVTDKEGKSVEVNIFGRASKEGREVVIVGESKSQLSQNDVYKFERERLRRFEGVFEEVVPVLVTHMTTSAGVAEYVKKREIALYYSYEF